jgi:hypothetical protein
MINFTKEERTRILPLRWFANICEIPAHYNLMMSLHHRDHDDYGIKYKYYAITSNWLYKPYWRWGTVYKAELNDH